MTLDDLIVKYDLPEADCFKVLLEILSKNSILCLAHYMREARMDCSDISFAGDNVIFTLDGYANAEGHNPDIVECIEHAIDEFFDVQDGRVFCDCEWNYERLFDIVKHENAELYEDYRFAYSLYSEIVY